MFSLELRRSRSASDTPPSRHPGDGHGALQNPSQFTFVGAKIHHNSLSSTGRLREHLFEKTQPAIQFHIETCIKAPKFSFISRHVSKHPL